ncbi:MAG TPA: hypothetical protein VG253_14185 [Streptosporangiaceae bacterium]|nr:hypothetical protein [Streptosporangiaceae bacterium]
MTDGPDRWHRWLLDVRFGGDAATREKDLTEFLYPSNDIDQLLDCLHDIGAEEQAAALKERLPAEGFLVLFLTQSARRAEFRFGREPHGSAADPWDWDDLDQETQEPATHNNDIRDVTPDTGGFIPFGSTGELSVITDTSGRSAPGELVEAAKRYTAASGSPIAPFELALVAAHDERLRSRLLAYLNPSPSTTRKTTGGGDDRYTAA